MKKNEVYFYDTTRLAYRSHPIKPASSYPFVGKNIQIKKYGSEKLAVCPGMHDLYKFGWILPAWDDMHIYASENSSMIYYGDGSARTQAKKPCPWVAGTPMATDISDGWKGSKKTLQPLHLASPWHVEGDMSLMLLPAFFHSDIDEFLEVFPGICDYGENFGAINCIVAPKKTGTFKIAAGTPLMHMIPIHKDNYSLFYGPAKQRNIDGNRSFYSRAKQWYRKYCLNRSKFKSTEIE